MMKQLDQTHSLYAPADADRQVAELNAQGDGWTYKAVHDPIGTGYSLIAVYDEEGEFVAHF